MDAVFDGDREFDIIFVEKYNKKKQKSQKKLAYLASFAFFA